MTLEIQLTALPRIRQAMTCIPHFSPVNLTLRGRLTVYFKNMYTNINMQVFGGVS